MSTEVKVPTLGESVTEATIGEWLKQPGEAVALDEPIASLETDKVAVEVPSPVAGVMGQQVVAVGDTVNVGAVIATIEAGDGKAAAPAPAPAAKAEAAAPASVVTTPAGVILRIASFEVSATRTTPMPSATSPVPTTSITPTPSPATPVMRS